MIGLLKKIRCYFCDLSVGGECFGCESHLCGEPVVDSGRIDVAWDSKSPVVEGWYLRKSLNERPENVTQSVYLVHVGERQVAAHKAEDKLELFPKPDPIYAWSKPLAF